MMNHDGFNARGVNDGPLSLSWSFVDLKPIEVTHNGRLTRYFVRSFRAVGSRDPSNSKVREYINI